MYEAVTQIGLPVWEQENDDAPLFARGTVVKQPGDRITKKELDDARQTDADIANLVKHGSIKEVK